MSNLKGIINTNILQSLIDMNNKGIIGDTPNKEIESELSFLLLDNIPDVVKSKILERYFSNNGFFVVGLKKVGDYLVFETYDATGRVKGKVSLIRRVNNG